MKSHLKCIACFVILMIAATVYAAPSNGIDESAVGEAGPRPVVAIIGTGDMGDSLGPRFAELGYPVVYGSRHPASEKSKNLVMLTGEGARITTQMDAPQAAEIVVLAVGWPAMETVARNLGSLDGKIVIDMSMPVE